MDKKPFGLMGLLANLCRSIMAKKDDCQFGCREEKCREDFEDCQCDYDEDDEDDESDDCGDDFPADYEEEEDERYEEGSPSEEWYNFYSQER